MPTDDDRRFFALGGTEGSVWEDGDVPVGGEGPAARFRFRMTPEGGWLFPVPIGVERLAEPPVRHGRWAIGDIVRLEGRRCEAAFALVSGGARARTRAERNLRRWAVADGWDLTILAGKRPLRPALDCIWQTTVCETCGRLGHRAAIAMPYVWTVPWLPSGCPECHRGPSLPARRR
jgi:hypothetical protein